MQNIFDETMENDKTLFTICIDENGYFTTENTNNLVQVKKMPSITNVKQLLAYKYNEEEQILEVDMEKMAIINQEIATPHTELTAEERLADLEKAFLELSLMMLGGATNG